ncbi:MAG: cob(I)yrinic acid a,c-diamide adenosyltransferase [Hungatella sp.]|nr:cob(I)yrinic acid a,c-diamide adenosyltransferase [Hungatella sp.]
METRHPEKTSFGGKTAKGCVHIYCGDGKGKTTAAAGLAVRAAGRGKRVLIARFLKNDDSGEVNILDGICGIRVKPCEKCFGFYYQMTREQKEEAGEYYGRLFDSVWEEAVGEKFDMVILDEIMAACTYGMVSQEKVADCLRNRPDSLEVVLTGRNPSPELVSLADYVSEIRKVKHPFDRGVGAREGIEF